MDADRESENPEAEHGVRVASGWWSFVTGDGSRPPWPGLLATARLASSVAGEHKVGDGLPDQASNCSKASSASRSTDRARSDRSTPAMFAIAP